jgi:hypothetical protein
MERVVVGTLAWVCACGPAVGQPGNSTSGLGSASGLDSAGEDSATATSDVSASSQPDPDSSGADVDDGADEGTKLDMPVDVPLVCPIEPRSNAAASGTTPVGTVDVHHGWFATAGGGKCRYGDSIMLLPTIDGALEQLGSEEVGPGTLTLFITLDQLAGETLGEFEVEVEHFGPRSTELAHGVATVETFAGPDAPEPILVGTFRVIDRGWDVAGEFAIPWCDLLATGGCGLRG